MKDVLKDLYSESGQEKIGFIVDSCIIEVKNIASDPFNNYMMSTQDIIYYTPIATALWHTHPNEKSNLSDEDYVTIKNWPNLKHYIIGSDGVRCYKWDKEIKAVIEIDG